MGAGASKTFAKTHGPMNPADIGTEQIPPLGGCDAAAAGAGDLQRQPLARLEGADVQLNRANGRIHHASPLGMDGDAANPLGEDQLNGVALRNSTVQFTPVSGIVGKPGSTAKYTKRRPIGKGAFGEAFIVVRNPSYDPSSCVLAERQVTNNQLSHPTRSGGTYVVKVMDLSSMRPQDRQYAQTEIICLAHTHHFAIIKYYEHYVLDSGDETMVIVTEFADHGDLARNLSRGRDTKLLADLTTTGGVGNNMNNSGVQSSSVGSSGSRTMFQRPTSGCEAAPAPQPVAALHLTEKEAGMYFVQLLAALHHIHKRRMIHRDVKSANLFLTSNGFIKLGDFGFSQQYESTVSSETIAGTFLGTPYYVSPEMWKGTRYGKKADVWAAGIVLYEMLMDGQRPFEAMGLTDLKRVVLESDVELPEFPPAAALPYVEHGALDGAPKRGKFSSEIRGLVKTIFQKDPQKRPSTEELLRTPIMQHYLFLFQRHVHSLFARDDALRAANPNGEPTDLAFPEAADKELVLQGLQDLNNVIKQEIQKELEDPGTLRYEGVVYKGNHDGTWKERYLALEDDVLIISLSRAKSAAEGADRSRKVPINMIKAVSMCQSTDPHVDPVDAGQPQEQPPQPGAPDYKPPCSFVLFMTESSSPIYFGVASAEELDSWMNVLMKALHID